MSRKSLDTTMVDARRMARSFSTTSDQRAHAGTSEQRLLAGIDQTVQDHVRSLGHAEAGSAMVEAAVVMPVLILFIFGLIQYGLIFATQLSLEHAALVGARHATLYNPNTTTQEVENVVRSVSMPFIDQNAMTVNVNLNYSNGTVSGARQVRITYALPIFVKLIVPQVSGNTYPLSAQSIMR